MSEPRVEIVIDELVLRGIPACDAEALSAALGGALGVYAGQAAAVGTTPTDRRELVRHARRVEVPAAAPTVLGDAVAHAVWSAVAGGGPA